MVALCISIDVERDYRRDNSFSCRGIEEGVPTFLDFLKSHRIPFDLMISGEVAGFVPSGLLKSLGGLGSLGCHGYSHSPGFISRMSVEEQTQEISTASETIQRIFSRRPVHFRAPNFSANGDTLQVLASLGYRSDSSVLPGRIVRRFRLFTVVDHRGAPVDPYFPSLDRVSSEGTSTILEVPVTPNPLIPGGPIGLGFLSAFGAKRCAEAIMRASGRYVIFLTHSWEMVKWSASDHVPDWVRRASTSNPSLFEELLSLLPSPEFTNLDEIVELETKNRRQVAAT